MVRNPFSNLKCMTLEEEKKYVQDLHLKFPEIKEEVLPDYLVEKLSDAEVEEQEWCNDY